MRQHGTSAINLVFAPKPGRIIQVDHHLVFAIWNVNGKAADGRLNYSASVVNGAGYKNPTRSDSMDFEARVGFVPVPGLT